MSAGLMAYLVPERETFAVVGCKDRRLLRRILSTMAEDIALLDEQFTTDSEEYGPGLTFTQALSELINGQFSRPDTCAFMYTYAFELVCNYWGEFLNNWYFCPCRHALFEQLDEILAAGGVQLRFGDLLTRVPPRLPDPRGDPCLGYWKAAELLAAQARLPALLPSLAGWERDALGSVLDWLTEAKAQPGSIIVAVYC